MGDVNQLNWISRHRNLIAGPVIEIGSRHYAAQTSVHYRDLCRGLDYVGVDLSEGENVDVALDFTSDYTVIEEKLGGRGFRTIICCSVLEHVDNVFKMAQNMSQLMAPGGVLFLSVPFAWRFHGYPSDYWRFTPKGVKYLFPDFAFEETHSTISSNVPDDAGTLSDDPNAFAMREFSQLVENRPGVMDRLGLTGLFGRKKKAEAKYPYVLLPTVINMIGIKK